MRYPALPSCCGTAWGEPPKPPVVVIGEAWHMVNDTLIETNSLLYWKFGEIEFLDLAILEMVISQFAM